MKVTGNSGFPGRRLQECFVLLVCFVHGSHLFGAVCCRRVDEHADFLGEYPGSFPHSALIGSAVDTFIASVCVALVLSLFVNRDRFAQCKLCRRLEIPWCPLRSDSGVVQTCRKLWFSTVAVLDMPVVANDRFLRCRRCSSCGCGRHCDHAVASWGLANS